MDLGCKKHEILSKIKVPQSIQECCRNCLRILSFKQMIRYFSNTYLVNINDFNLYSKVIESEKHCQLCGKTLGKLIDVWRLRLCSDCYLISFECVESTLAKKQISILYLSWWCNSYSYINCSSGLIFASDCQKYCTNCLIV
ncbi:unnamed protein product [Rhizophagus irregularis]|nr:unnamed protein product [Rhizophagus irregularis]